MIIQSELSGLTDYPFVILEKPVKTLRLNTISTDTLAGATSGCKSPGETGL